MSSFVEFVWAVINNWAGYSTGGLLVAAVAFWAIWRDKPLPRGIALWLSAAFLLMAFYKAWADQYIENAVGREAGSLAFLSIGGDLNRHGDVADPQLHISFKNLQSRLLEYHIDRVTLTIEGHAMEQDFANLGGYVYGGQEGRFALNTLWGLPLDKEPLTGLLEYAMTYHVVGSHTVHHSRKKLRFDMFYTSLLGGKYQTLEEFED